MEDQVQEALPGQGSAEGVLGGVQPAKSQQPQQPWQPLIKPVRRKVRRAKPETVMRMVVHAMAHALPSLAAEGQWVPLRRATQFLLWLTHHAPGSASMFIAARGTVRIQDAIRAATASDHPAASGMLQPGTALLLQCVQLSEGAADLVVESQSVRLLLQLLLRPNVGPTTKRHIGGVLQALAATKLVYRDVLHGAGVVDVLLTALTDAAVLTDLLLVQELLWVLVSLADDDLVYKDDMREAGLPALLVSLLSVYQANQGAPELRPIAAQILRCLQLMAAGDEAMQVACVGLGLIRLLAVQLHLDIHQLDEPPLPAAASNILSLNSLPTTPKSPHVGHHSNTSNSHGHPSFAVNPNSPLRRSGSGGSSPRPGSAGPGNRRGGLEPPIPEDAEADVVAEGARQPGATLGGRGSSFANYSSEAAALRGLGVGPSPVQRLAAAALLRVVLQPVMSRATVEVLVHGMMLPALHMQLVGPRLSLAAEATTTLRTLLSDSPQRAALAAQAGVAPLIVQLLSATNLELATTAADVLTLLGTSCPTVLEPLAASAVAGLTDLLRETAAHSQSLGLTRRHSTASQLSMDGRRRASLPSALDSPMSPIPEGARGAGGLSPDEQAAGAVWAAERAASADSAGLSSALLGPLTDQQQQQGSGRSFIFRHPSLGPAGAGGQPAGAAAAQGPKGQQQQQQQQRRGRVVSSSGTPAQDHLTSRERAHHPATLRGSSSSCLVCAAGGQVEACSYCYLSAAVRGLLLLLQPLPELQGVFVDGGGVEVVVVLMAGLVGGQAEGLMACLCGLMVPVVTGNSRAQDQVRLAGGVDVLVAAFKQRLGSSSSNNHNSSKQQQQQQQLQDVAPLASAVLQLLSVLVADNSANKLALRESGALSCVTSILDMLLKVPPPPPTAAAAESAGPSTCESCEGLAESLLSLLSACLPDSPGSQATFHSLGGTRLLLQLLRYPSNSPSLGLAAIHALSLMATKQQPAALAEATAGGLVAVVMNVLQQQAMAGVLVSEVCMVALPTLLEGNGPGKQQALQYGVLPLLVHLLRSSPSPTTLTAAAHSLAVLAERDTELQGQVTAAGGLSALLDKLDTSNGPTPAAAAEAQVAAAEAAAAAAAAAAAEVVAKAAAEAAAHSQQRGSGLAAAGEEGEDEDDSYGSSEGASDEGSSTAAVLQQLPGSQAAAAMAVAAAASEAAVSDAMQALVARRIATVRVRVACLQAVAALAHDNSFTKNTARQQGVMLLLVDLLRSGSSVLQAALLAEAAAAAGGGGQQQPQLGRGSGLPSYCELEPGRGGERGGGSGGVWGHHGPHHLRVRTPRSSLASNQQQQQQQQEQQQEQAAQLQLLVAAVNVLAELCHGNHSNQQAAAAEGLIDTLASLAAAAMGAQLETAGRHVALLSGVFDALAAAVEFCTPNKLVAREAGAVDVTSALLLMVAEVPDVTRVLRELCLQPAVSSCCSTVVALAQDCEDNQAAFLRHPDFLPALFRLLSVNDPMVAAQAARALEFIAIRADIADDAEDRSEFEADTLMALIRVLSHGALTITGSGRTAAARAATAVTAGSSSSGPSPSAAAVREAAALLSLVVDASDPSVQKAAAAAMAAGGGSNGSSSSMAAAGLGTAPAHPAAAGGAAAAGGLSSRGSLPLQQQQHGGSSPQKLPVGRPPLRHSSLPAGSGPRGVTPGSTGSSSNSLATAAVAVDGTTTPPHALLPDVVTDHTSGLAVLRTWSLPQDQGGQWQQLVGRSAPAFQTIRAAVPPGPWKAFREQVSWLLLLLASKSAANRALVSRVQRTTLTPLATQLENAERFAEQAAMHEAAAAAAAAADASKPASLAASPMQQSRASSRSGSVREHQGVASSVQRQGSVTLHHHGTHTGSSNAPEPQELGPAAAGAGNGVVYAGRTVLGQPGPAAAAELAGGGAGAGAAACSVTAPAAAVAADGPERYDSGAVGDDELSMLQAEVAFLGLMSHPSSRGATEQ